VNPDPSVEVTLKYDYIPDAGCNTPNTPEPAHCSVTRAMKTSAYDALASPSECTRSTPLPGDRLIDCSGGCFVYNGVCTYAQWNCSWPPDGGGAVANDCSWRL
jgi:hypothetical protein